MNQQSPNISDISSIFYQKIRYSFSFSRFKIIKNLININKKTSRASDEVKHVCYTTLCMSLKFSIVLLLGLFAVAHQTYLKGYFLIDATVMLSLLYIITGTLWTIQTDTALFDSAPLDSKTLKDLKDYITCSVKENDSLEFDYDLIDYHLKMIEENPGEYAIVDLRRIFLHIENILSSNKVISVKKQEVLSLINNSNEQQNNPLLSIKAALKNKNSLYLNK